MSKLFRTALFALGALIAAACGSSVDAAADTANTTADEATAAVSDEAVSAVDEFVNAGQEDEADVDDDPAEEAPATTAAPEPVTASTVHDTTSDDFPDILAAQATPDGDGTWRFDVTVSSTYDTPQRYADAWRVVGPDGTQFGIRVLTHDHASEQPFTRSQSGIEIPADITTVTIEGRDLSNGWGGGTLEVALG